MTSNLEWNNQIDDILTKCMRKVETTIPLKFHPGFTFGLGCNEWKGSNFEGITEGWSGKPKISWLAKGLFQSADTDKPYSQGDINIFVSPLYNVPHLRMSVSRSSSGFSLSLDYPPRYDLINANMTYFDTYFKGLDGWICEAERLPTVCYHAPSEVFMSRIVRGPYSLNIDVQPEAYDTVQQLCLEQVDRWCNWIHSSQTVDETEVKILYERDNSFHTLRLEEEKFILAKLFNPDFAPKASEIAAAVMGPNYDTITF